MLSERLPCPEFAGFPVFRANVTFVPIQFFTVVVPHCSRGTIRVVGYALRRLLGWVDAHGNPTRERLRLSYRELIEQAGLSRDAIAEALREALDKQLLRCVQWPRPDSAGRAAQNGVYEVCWDEHGPYTDNPADFHGFYYPEAVVVNEAGTAPRPKAARKNIPNALFDVLLPRERLAVIRVVAALLFYSIQWGPGGERKVPVSFSITQLARLTRLSRRHVHGAVVEACQRGYVERLEAGRFDAAAGQSSRAATYAIRWAGNGTAFETSPRSAVSMSLRTDRSEKGNGAPVGKGERKESEMVNGERSEKGNGINIKLELKTETTAEPRAPAAAATPECPTVNLLRAAGFDDATAARLATRHSREAIQRQLDWLPLRHATRNRLGLLRRAIEQDWPRPAGLTPDDEQRFAEARVFARHYYAAYHGNEGQTTVEPFPKDLEAAGQFLKRLADLAYPGTPAEQGGEFGQWMRGRHRNDPRAKPNLSFALVLHAEAFLRLKQQANAAQTRSSMDQQRIAYQKANLGAYVAYLRQAETALQRTQPELLARFTDERARVRHAMTGGLLLVSADTLARFDREESRLLALAEFCRQLPNPPILGFWAWDAGRRKPVVS